MPSLKVGLRARRAPSWLFAAAVAAVPACALATSSSWTFNGDGNWTVGTNWLGGVPAAASDVFITHSDSASRTITYNYSGASIQFNSMTVDNSGTGSDLFSQSANTFNSISETIGNSSSGYWSLMGGTHNVGNGGFVFGSFGGSKGIGTLAAGSLSVAGDEIIALHGAATFSQIAGSHTIGGAMILGASAASGGTFNLNGGSVAAASLYVGGSASGSGGFGSLVVNAGTLNVSNSIQIYNAADGTNSSGLTITGGAVSTGGIVLPDWSRLQLISGMLSIGGGSSSASGDLIVGNFGSAATLNHTGTSFLSTSGDLILGYSSLSAGIENSAGIFNQSGNSIVNIGGSLIIGSTQAVSTGTYTLAGGTLTASNVVIGGGFGQFGPPQGALNVTGGTLTVANAISLPTFGTATFTIAGGLVTTPSIVFNDWSSLRFNNGTLNLSAGTSSNGGNLAIGSAAGTATLNQTGSNTFVSASAVLVGSVAGSAGTYNLGAGTLTGTNLSEYIGVNGTGVFVQTGGANLVSGNFSNFTVGSSAAGTFVLSGGTLSVAGNETIGSGASGTFNQSGGTNSATFVGLNRGSVYNLSGSGTLSSGGEAINGTATFNQTGGSNTVTGTISSNSAYLISAGTLNAASFSGNLSMTGGSANIGTSFSVGSVTISGGSITAGSVTGPAGATLTVNGGTVSAVSMSPQNWSSVRANNGTLNLNGGTASAPGALLIGNNGGTFVLNQSGAGAALNAGTAGFQVPSGFGSICVGNGTNSTGIYNLGGGIVHEGQLYVGFNGTGTFVQTGGTHTIQNAAGGASGQYLYLGRNTGSSGVYNLSAGNLYVNDQEFVGYSGSGTFIQTGGSHTIGPVPLLGDLYVGGFNNVNAAYNLSGGTLSVNGYENIGTSGSASFVQSGGVHSIGRNMLLSQNVFGASYALSNSGSLIVSGDESLGFGARFNQSGGSQSVAGTITVPGSTVFNLSGGVLGVSTLSISQGSFTQSAGTLTTGTVILDRGTYSFTGGAVVANNFIQTSGTYIGTLTVGGAAITNFNLQSGTVSASTMNALAGGTMNHSGGTLSASTLAIGDGLSPAMYNLSASGVLSVSGSEIVGNTGNGDFSQIGGANSAPALTIANFSGSAGTYAITDGIASFGAVSVGGSALTAGGAGSLNVGGAGSLTVLGNLKVWNTGAINLSGGTLSTTSLDLSGNPSLLSWSGGALALTGVASLNVGPGGLLGANLTLNNGMMLQTPNTCSIGAGGTLTLNGGAVTAGTLDTGGTPARLNWAAGTVGITGTSGLVIGPGGPLGSTITLGPGRALQVSATTSLASGGSILLNGGTFTVGSLDTGGNLARFAWNAGAITTGSLTIDTVAPSPFGSSISITDAKTLAANGVEYVGYLGNGTLNQSGGTNNIGTLGSLEMGYNAGSNGVGTLSGGTLSIFRNEDIGINGNATFNQSGGSHVINAYQFSSQILQLGAGSLGKGVYNLSGGSLTVRGFNFAGSATGYEFVGPSGNGTFNQTGGSNTVEGYLYVGSGKTGTYLLSDGSLSVTAGVFVGSGGTGIFNQSGGTANFGDYRSDTGGIYAGVLAIGPGGTLNLSGGHLIVNSRYNIGSEAIGGTSGGVFNQTGGVNFVGSNLYLGNSAGTTGTYSLSAGTISAPTCDVGLSGTGAFLQSGGVHVVGDLYIAHNSGSTGTYSLSSTGSLIVSDAENVGFGGTGTFSQSGGSQAVVILSVGGNTGSSGSYILSGGSLSGVNEFIGSVGVGTFSQSGGSNHVTGTLSITSTGTYIFGGGTLITDNPPQFGGRLTVKAGSGSFDGRLSLAAAGVTLTGGTIALESAATSPAQLSLTSNVTVASSSFSAGLISTGTAAMTGVINLGGDRTFDVAAGGNAAGDLLVSAQLVGGTITKIGSGTMVLSNPSSTFSGLTINGGVFKVTSGASYTCDIHANADGPSAGTVSVDADGELGAAQNKIYLAGGELLATGSFVSGRSIVVGDATGNGNGRIEVTSVNTLTLSSPITGLAGLSKIGGGTLLLQSSNSYLGPTHITAGTLLLGPIASLNPLSVVTVDAAGNLAVGDGAKLIGALFGSGTLTLGNGTLTLGSLGAVTPFSGRIAGPGAIVKTGPRTAMLSGSCAFAGGVSVNAGTLVLSANNSFSGGVNLGGGTLSVSSDANLGNIANALNFGGGTFQSTGSFTSSRNMDFSGVGGGIDITGNNILTANSAISGSGTLHKTGSGVLRLAASNPFTGTLQIDAGGGTVSFAGPNGAMNSVAAINLVLGGTIELNNSTALGGNNSNRLSDTATLSFRGGGVSMIGADGTSSSELLGPLSLVNSATSINIVSGIDGAASVSFASLQRQLGAGVGVSGIGIGTINRVLFRAPPSLGAWAKVNGLSAKYDPTAGLVPVTFPSAGPAPGLLWGDANQDGVVNALDYTTTIADLGISHATWQQGDFNDDDVVDQQDLNLLLTNAPNLQSLAPEPAPSCWLAALCLRRCRIREKMQCDRNNR